MELTIGKGLTKGAIFVAPVFVIAFFVLLRIGDERMYYFLLYEDHPIEVLSAFLYFCATVMAGLTASRLLARGNRWIGGGYVLLTLAMFFIFGEEISWGQRILGIASPEFFLEHSFQQEINVHNLQPVQDLLHRIYIVIGLGGGLVWIATAITPPDHRLFNRCFTPSWYLMLYFLPVAIFYSYYEFVRPHGDPLGVTGRDQEVAELLLCLGFLLFILENWLRVREQSGVRANRYLDARPGSDYVVPRYEPTSTSGSEADVGAKVTAGSSAHSR